MDSYRLHKRGAFISPSVFVSFSIISLHQQIVSLDCGESVMLAAISASRKEGAGDDRGELAGKPRVHLQLISAKPCNILLLSIYGQQPVTAVQLFVNIAKMTRHSTLMKVN
jgi:hypothetical protein